MSKKVDLVFCKIAITANMVSEEQAQKVLALVDKREQETGRRPIIGAVFTKYQLLTTEQAKKVNAAVVKRVGQAMPTSAPARRGRGGGAKRRSKPKRRKRTVDQKTLMTGIGFGAVFLAVFVTIAYYFVTGGREDGDGATEVTAASASASAAELARTAAKKPELSIEDRELDKGLKQELFSQLTDVLRDQGENPARGKKTLAAVRATIARFEKQGFIIPDDLLDQVRNAAAAMASVSVEDETADAAATTPSPPAASSSASDDSEDLGDVDFDDI